MITKEDIGNIANKIFFNSLVNLIPLNAKINRKAIEGTIQIKLPKREEHKLSTDESLNFDENNQIIETFIHNLEENLSHCDLSTFYENIKKLRIINKEKTIRERLGEILSINCAGYYCLGTNEIRIYPDKELKAQCLTDNTITHELLHLASARSIKGLHLSGFKRDDYNIIFGVGLNEGYTEILNRRYFSNHPIGSYTELQPLAVSIENLVGKRKMEQSYFSNDLDGLITELEKYTSRQEVIKLIQTMDYIYKCYGKPGESFLQDKLSRSARVDIANMYLKIYNEEYAAKRMDSRVYKDLILRCNLYIDGYGSIDFYNEARNNDSIPDSVHLGGFAKVGKTISYEEYCKIADEYYSEFQKKFKFTYDTKTTSNKSPSELIEQLKDKIKENSVENHDEDKTENQSTKILTEQNTKQDELPESQNDQTNNQAECSAKQELEQMLSSTPVTSSEKKLNSSK